MWPARELRAQILSEKGRTDAALEDLSTNRKEALALGAWWLAFRGLERECEIHLGKGNRDAAYKACQELENVEGKSIPQILGRMQRAVILVEEVESSDGEDSARETALPLLAQAIADVGKLEEILPRNEIEGIRMWLGSHHARCLRALEQFEEAIVVAEQVLKLATDVESKNDISGALALIQKCYECAGKPKDAFTSAEARFHFCKRHFPELREDAADSAAAAGRIISEMSSQPMARETRELAKHWLSQALSLYSDTGRTEAMESTQGQIAELEE